VETIGDRYPVAREWTSWVKGTVSQDDIQSSMLRNLQAMDSTITTAPLIKHPEPIQHIPTKITLDFAQSPPGDDPISVLYGAEPTRQKTSSWRDHIWYRQGSTSQSPKIHVKFLARRRGQRTIVSDDVAIHSIWKRMLQEQLHPKLVDLAATGSSYSLDVGAHSLSVSFGGFRENMPAMIKMVAEEIQNGVDITQVRSFQSHCAELEG
jgi:secreted Zn-dependent insulinase-like peptidase